MRIMWIRNTCKMIRKQKREMQKLDLSKYCNKFPRHKLYITHHPEDQTSATLTPLFNSTVPIAISRHFKLALHFIGRVLQPFTRVHTLCNCMLTINQAQFPPPPRMDVSRREVSLIIAVACVELADIGL